MSADHIKTRFRVLALFYSFFVQIKIDTRLVIMQSNLESSESSPTLDMMGKERREGKEALTGQSGAPRRLACCQPTTNNKLLHRNPDTSPVQGGAPGRRAGGGSRCFSPKAQYCIPSDRHGEISAQKNENSVPGRFVGGRQGGRVAGGHNRRLCVCVCSTIHWERRC